MSNWNVSEKIKHQKKEENCIHERENKEDNLHSHDTQIESLSFGVKATVVDHVNGWVADRFRK
jgi:hypothetical protein